MARFDVYDTDAGLFVDVQTNLIQGLNTRLVVPLLLEDDAPPLLLRKLHRFSRSRDADTSWRRSSWLPYPSVRSGARSRHSTSTMIVSSPRST